MLKLKFEEAISVPESERRSVADFIDYQSIGNIPIIYFFVSPELICLNLHSFSFSVSEICLVTELF